MTALLLHNAQLTAYQEAGFADEGKQFARYLESIFPNLPANTRKAIASDWRQYCVFCLENGLRPTSDDMESMSRTLLSFIDSQSSRLKVNTIQRRITSLKTLFNAMNVVNPISNDLITKEAIRARLKKIASPAGQAKPLARTIIDDYIKTLNFNCLLQLRTALILTLAHDTMCRASEIANIKVENITKRFTGNGSVLIERSKNDKAAIGSYRFIRASTMRIIDLWLAKTQIAEGHLLRPIHAKSNQVYRLKDGQKCEPINYSTILKAFHSVGQTNSYTAHSARVGSALEQIEAGINSQKIQLAGGWKSPYMIAYYGRQLDDQNSGSAELAKLHGE